MTARDQAVVFMYVPGIYRGEIEFILNRDKPEHRNCRVKFLLNIIKTFLSIYIHVDLQ